MSTFRFENLTIWQKASEVTYKLFDIADVLENKKLYRFAEQLRGASLSITNNIAEGSGSESKNEFRLFLNYSRRSVFECANILIMMHRKSIIDDDIEELNSQLEVLSKMITNFKKSLK
jgi:four helix bundle protein